MCELYLSMCLLRAFFTLPEAMFYFSIIPKDENQLVIYLKAKYELPTPFRFNFVHAHIILPLRK